MRLHVIARGKIGRSAEQDLCDRYAKRIAWPFKLTELPDSGGTVPPPLTPAREVLLDERGRQLTSEEFAAQLGTWRDGGVRETRFHLGAADGHGPGALGDAARERADLLIGFGAMTWPHLLVRAMLMEQLWRATSIIAGHPYHRSG